MPLLDVVHPPREARISTSLAGVHVHGLRAHLALDVAAPVELAVAALAHRHLLGVVAAAAAHQVAAVHAVRGPVALPALCTCEHIQSTL